MKRVILALIISLMALTQTHSQTIKTEEKPKQLIEQRSIYLNGGARASAGGKSRTYIKIDLPENTKEWYYSFTTSAGQSGTKNLNLAVQLSSFLVDPTGLSATALSGVKVPTGSSSVDIYLCDRTNLDKFLKKVDNWGGTYNYIMEGTVENTKQGLVQIDDVSQDTWYLGLKNPSTWDGVNIIIEVVAIIEEVSIIEKSEEEQKADLYGGLGWKQFENGDYQKCIEYSDKANEYYELGWVNANKGLAQLMLGQETDAMDTYVNAITLIKKQNNPGYVFSEVIKDLDNVLGNNADLAGASEIKDILEMEYEKYK